MSQPRPNSSPSTASTEELFRAWRGSHDPQVRAELIERFLPLARKLAARYRRSGEPFEDLVQVASVGLIKAVERFDPDYGANFTTFAVPTIVGELKRHFRDTTWSVQVDRRAQERARAVIGAQRALAATGRAATVTDIAEFLEWEAEEVLEGLQAALAYSAVSLDAPAPPSQNGSDGETNLFDTVGDDDGELDLVDDRATLGSAVRRLPKLERRILYLRYTEDLSQREIASLVGVSQMHVSRLLRQALAHLREELA